MSSEFYTSFIPVPLFPNLPTIPSSPIIFSSVISDFSSRIACHSAAEYILDKRVEESEWCNQLAGQRSEPRSIIKHLFNQ